MASSALKLREGAAPVRDRLMTTVFLAGLLHATVILGLTFEAAIAGGDAAPGLEVLLVSDELPETESNPTATYLAQRTQLGSGNTEESVPPRNRASDLTIPPHEGAPDGRTLASEGDRPGGDAEPVLAAAAAQADILHFATSDTSGADRADPLLLEEWRTEQPGPEDEAGPARLRGPKRDELWITPDAREATLAPYLDAWRRKVERIGTLNYPAAARREKLEASPVVEVAIASDGQLEKAIVRRSSGRPDLDQAALAILKLASPFDPFPPELAAEYRVLRFAYEWQFVDGRIEAGGVSAVP
ncbi:MAG: energy transducer TonB [Gammaproteobacteria bacterium]